MAGLPPPSALAAALSPAARFRRRGLSYGERDQLARSLAGGLSLDWADLGEDSRAELRAFALEILQRVGMVPHA